MNFYSTRFKVPSKQHIVTILQVSETMAVSNGHLPNSFEEGEDKPMLVVKKSGDGPGITALLNRQLQGTPPPF